MVGRIRDDYEYVVEAEARQRALASSPPLTAAQEQKIFDIASLANSPQLQDEKIIAAAAEGDIPVLLSLSTDLGVNLHGSLARAIEKNEITAAASLLRDKTIIPGTLDEEFVAAARKDQGRLLQLIDNRLTEKGVEDGALRAAQDGSNNAMQVIADLLIQKWQFTRSGVPNNFALTVLRGSFNAAVRAGNRETAAIVLRVLNQKDAKSKQLQP